MYTTLTKYTIWLILPMNLEEDIILLKLQYMERGMDEWTSR